MTRPVAEDVVTRIAEKGALGRQAWKRGAIDDAEAQFLSAWNLLPDPKTDHDYAQSLARGLVKFSRDTKQPQKAKSWLDVMRLAYGPGPDDSVEFMAGTVYFEAGDLNEAFRIFDGLYGKFKQRPFQGEDKKYLDFYKNYKK
jgi:hypothetical protein